MRSEAPQAALFLPWLLTVCKVGGHFFASGGGLLPLLRFEVLRMPPVLEGPGLLFRRVQPLGEAPGSPGSTATLPADPQRKESSPPGGEPPSPRVT